MGTGSEVHIANDAAKLLEADGIRVRLVSHALPGPLRRAGPRLPRPGPAAGGPRPRRRRGGEPDRLAPLGRRRTATSSRWRASAPRRRRRSLYEHFGFTGEAVAERARAVLEQEQAMSVTAGQRAPRGAHRRGHQRLARPDPPRHDRERRARPHGARRTRCAASRRTRRSSRRRSSARPTTTTTSPRPRTRGCPRARSTAGSPCATSSSPPTCCAASTTTPAAHDGYVSLEVAPRLAHDTEGTLEQARLYWGLVDRPNLMIKIPATPEGIPAIEQALYEGMNVNVTLLFAVAPYEDVMRAFIRAHASAATPRACRSTATRSPPSSSRASTPRSTSGWRPPAARTSQGRAGLANARAAYQAFKRVFGGEEFAALRDAGARCSARCGRRPASRTRPTPTRSTSTGSSGPTRSTRCRCRRCRPPRGEGEVTGATADEDPARRPRGAGRGRDRPRRRHRPAAARGHRGVRGPDEQAARRHRGQARGDRHRPARVVRGRPAARARAAGRRRGCAKAAEEDVVRRHLAQGRHALGAAGHARGRATGSAGSTIAEKLLEDCPRPRGVRRARCARTGSPTSCCSAWAARASRPRSSAARARRRRARCGCTCSTRPSRSRSRRVADAIDLAQTLFIVSSKSGGTIEPNALLAHFRARRSPTPRTSSRSPTRAPRWPSWPSARASAARSCPTRRSAAATRRSRRSASSPPRSPASTSQAVLEGAQVAAENCELRGGQLRPLARRRARRAGAARAATS